MSSQNQNTAPNRPRLGVGLLLLVAAAPPRDASVGAFSAPRRARPRTSVPIPRSGGKIPAFRRPTTELAGGLADLDSLYDITANPGLFPATSDYIRTLSRAGGAGAAGEAPSAEEFLTQLSAEMQRASSRSARPSGASPRRGEESAGPAAGKSPPGSFLRGLAESTLPAASSAMGVAAAAQSYNPASYASIASQMASANGAIWDSYGVDGGIGERANEYATAYAASANAADYADAAGAASESFAAWHNQGGSNALRDLASSIPVVEQQDVGYAATPDNLVNMNGYYASAANDYYYVAENAADVGVQQVAPVLQDVAGAPETWTDAASSGLAVDTPPLPEVGGGLTDSLSSQLSDLSYDGLQNADGQAAIDALHSSPKSPLLGDYLKANLERIDMPKVSPPKLDHIDLPKISAPKFDGVDLPKMSNPFAELDLSSSKEKLGEAFSSVSHSFDGLGDKVADISNSLETLSSQVGKAAEAGASGAKAFGNAVQSGAERAAATSNSFSGSFKGASVQARGAADAGASGTGVLVDAIPSGGSVAVELSNVEAANPGVSGAGGLADAVPSGGAAASEFSQPPPKVHFEAPTLPHVELPQAPHFDLPEVQLRAPSLPKVDIHLPSLPNNNAALERVGESSLSDFGNGVVHSVQFIGEGVIHAVQFMGGILVKFLDLILGAVAGTSVGSILADVQSSVTSVVNGAMTSVTSAINGATHAAVSTIDNVANMSIKEILQHLVALLMAITDVLLKVANAVVYLVSGRDGPDWALQASMSVHEASSQLLASASHAYDEVTHESIAQLANSIGDYSHHVGDGLLALVGNLNGAAAEGIASSLDPDTVDRVATAVQTALTL